MATDAAVVLSATKTSNTSAALYSNTDDVEQAFTQLHVDSSSGLKNSPLGRLPAELRNKIFEWAFSDVPSSFISRNGPNGSMSSFFSTLGTKQAFTTCSQIDSALNIMATCKQIRHETAKLLLSLNDINIMTPDIRGSLAQLERSAGLLKKVPSSLCLSLGRVVLSIDCVPSLYRERAHIELCPWSVPGLRQSLIASSQGIHPFQLFLDLDMAFHAWGNLGNGNTLICHKDAPVTLDDCSHLHNIIPVGDDRMAVLRRAEETVNNRLVLLRHHSMHRFCPVRARLSHMESGLEVARQYLRDIVELTFE
jgi:hypothetical protein